MNVWGKSGATEEQYKADNHACVVEMRMLGSQDVIQMNTCMATTTSPMMKNICIPSTTAHYWEDCMRAKSYDIVKVIPMPEANSGTDVSQWDLEREPELPYRWQGYSEEDIATVMSGKPLE